MLLPIQIEYVGIIVAYSLFLVLIQRVVVDIDRLYELRAKMNMHQNHLMKMVKDNTASKEEIAEKQKVLINLSSESMKMQFKPMIITIPIYIILIFVVFPKFLGNIPNFNILSFSLSYKLAFVVISVIVAMVVQTLLSLYDRNRLKDKYRFGITGPSFKENVQTNQ